MANALEDKVLEMIGYICEGIRLTGDYPDDWITLASALADASRKLIVVSHTRREVARQLLVDNLPLQA